MVKLSIASLLFILLLPGCTMKKQDNPEIPIARAYDEYLYPSDINGQIADGLSQEDSARIARRVIDDWIRNRLLLKQAEIHLPLEMKDVEKQVEEYRSSLLIFKYKQNLLRQNIDTIISEKEIADYYKDNASNYVLESDVVQATFIKIPLSAPNIGNVRSWYRSDREESLESLKNYCSEYAMQYSIQDSSWIIFTDLLAQTPIETANPSNFLNYNKYLEAQDSTAYYFIKINGRLKEGDVKPLPLVKNNIRTVLLNKQKLEYLQDLENTVYREGLSRNQAEIFN